MLHDEFVPCKELLLQGIKLNTESDQPNLPLNDDMRKLLNSIEEHGAGPSVVAAMASQAGELNIHTRYLHEGVLDYAEAQVIDVDLRKAPFQHDGRPGSILDVLLAHGVDVALVVSHQDNPTENIWFDSVVTTAGRYGIPVATPEDPNTPAFMARLAGLGPDFLFSFYYRHMLRPELLALATRGAYNMHGSLLPKNPGVADFLIERGLARRGFRVPLAPLDDTVEWRAHGEAVARARKTH